MAKSTLVPSAGAWQPADVGKAGVALDVVVDRYIFVKDGRSEGTPPIEQGCGEGLFFFSLRNRLREG